MSVRANWHSGAAEQLPADDSDPFENMQSGTTSSRTILTPESPPEDFRAAFKRLNRRINALYASGVTCPLRDAGECHCASCPISQVNNPDAKRHLLCKQGVEEERTVMLARVAGLGLAPSGV